MLLPAGVTRENRPDGAVRIWNEKASFTYHRPRPGVVLVIISGSDNGQFGFVTLDEMREDLSRYAPCELFVDTVEARGVQMPVQELWTEWFSNHRPALKSVNVLVGGKFMHITVEVAKLFSRTGELIRVYLDAAAFDEALERAAPGAAALRRAR
jgi:hypothetical protein